MRGCVGENWLGAVFGGCGEAEGIWHDSMKGLDIMGKWRGEGRES